MLILLVLVTVTLFCALALVFATASLPETAFASPRVHVATLALTVATILSAATGYTGLCLNHSEVLRAFSAANAMLAIAGALTAAFALNLSETAIIDNVTKHFAPDHPAPEVLDAAVQHVRLLAVVVISTVFAEVRTARCSTHDPTMKE